MKKIINIIHLLPSLDVGGMENGIVNLVNNIEAEKFNSTICCLNNTGPMQERIKNNNVQIIELKQKDGRAYGSILKLMKIFINKKIDIVHTHNYYTGIYGIAAAKFTRKKILHGLHGFDYDVEKNMFKKYNKENILFKCADHLCSVSESIKLIANKNYSVSEDRITVIKNGVDYDKFQNQFDNYRLRKDFGIDNYTTVIGSVGRLHYQKNYQLLVSAVCNLIKKNYNICLLLAGDGAEKEQLIKQSQELGIKDKIKLIGKRNDIPRVLSLIDVFVLPSLLEGMSNTILEAMCAGKAIIASDVGGNPEMIIDGYTGLLFKSGQLKDLIKKIKFVLNNNKERDQLCYNAKYAAEKEYTIKTMVYNYEKLYMHLFSA